jgi:coenzyme PQQ biosynthesis protein C
LPDEFEARLRSVGEVNYHDKHPFNERMHAGELTEPELRGWVRNRFYYQRNIPVKDALIVAKLPTRDDRRAWLQRIVDHDGLKGDEGGLESWLRLGEAVNISRPEMWDDGRSSGRAVRGRQLRQLLSGTVLARSGGGVAHRAVRSRPVGATGR